MKLKIESTVYSRTPTTIPQSYEAYLPAKHGKRKQSYLSNLYQLDAIGESTKKSVVILTIQCVVNNHIADKQVTFDPARLMEPQAEAVSCSDFAEAIIEPF